MKFQSLDNVVNRRLFFKFIHLFATKILLNENTSDLLLGTFFYFYFYSFRHLLRFAEILFSSIFFLSAKTAIQLHFLFKLDFSSKCTELDFELFVILQLFYLIAKNFFGFTKKDFSGTNIFPNWLAKRTARNSKSKETFFPKFHSLYKSEIHSNALSAFVRRL